MLTTLKISNINFAFQPEKCLEAVVVQQYADDLRHNRPVRPVTVYHDGTTYFLFDGFHRVAAAKELGRATIEAEIRPGGLPDMEMRFSMAAVLYGALGPETCRLLTGFDIEKRRLDPP
jgi:uncharacterized ParB-like nuclease family protein